MNFQEPYLLAMQDQAPKMARYPIEPPRLTLQIGIIEEAEDSTYRLSDRPISVAPTNARAARW